MSLVLIALIGGGIFYIARIVMEYKDLEMEKRPAIEELEQIIMDLTVQITAEAPLMEDVKMRVAALRGVREDLMLQLEACKRALDAEKKQYQRLALELQKRQFKGTLERGRRLVLK